MSNAKINDIVEVSTIRTKKNSIITKITKILSSRTNVSQSFESIFDEFVIPSSFSPKVKAELKLLSGSISQSDLENRLDLRDNLVFTIDPIDAKDYDDAVSLFPIDHDVFELGIHIADVSQYVQEDSEIDLEALKRGTSIYLPGMVIPMLPHQLTNEICSLNEGEDKLTFSIIFKITKEGKILDTRIVKSLIKSKKRFSYEQAQLVLNEYKNRTNNLKIRTKNDITSKSCDGIQDIFGSVLYQMDNLSKKLFHNRTIDGSIDFNSSEVEFQFDDNYNVLDIKPRLRLETHRLIEEFMLLANKTIAEKIENIPSFPFLFRVHDNPIEEKVIELCEYLTHFGIHFKKSKFKNSKGLQNLLDDIKGSPNENILNSIIIRTMAKAYYSENNIGHFGLGFKHYTHFTSPIRRYPDLLVHRFLSKFLSDKRVPNRQEKVLSYIANHCSEMERKSMKIEREAIKIKQIEFLQSKIDIVIEGVITNIVNFGLFVEIPKYLISGLVHIKNLKDDYYHFEEKKYRLIGEHTKRVYKLGDKIKLKIYNLDVENRRIDFEMI